MVKQQPATYSLSIYLPHSIISPAPGSYEDNSYLKSVITLNGSSIKNVEIFRYLGC